MWITKYALTQGVFTATNAEVCDSEGTMIKVHQSGSIERAYFHKPYWHTTEAEACAQVAKMISAAKKSLAKKMAKLDAYKFDTKPWAQ